MANWITEAELLDKYKGAAKIPQEDRAGYIRRACAYARGFMGGEPATVTDDMKDAVALLVQAEKEPVDAYANNSFYDRSKTPQGRAEVILAQYKKNSDSSSGTVKKVQFL